MKTIYFHRFITCIFLMVFVMTVESRAQIVRLSQGFDNYIGSVATVPAGWYISWNSTSSPSYYITAGNYGAAIPSYKFGNDGDSIISPFFFSADTLRFWCKGQAAFSAQNSLFIFYSPDSAIWYPLQSIDSLPVVDTTLAYPLPCEAHHLMFIYHKVSGNLAFDDVLVTMTDYSPIAGINTTLNLHCEGDSVCFIDMSTMSGCDSIVARIWDFGDSTATDSSETPCHIFSQTGNYTVKLLVTASNGNTDSTSLTITVYALPVAQFSYVNANGTFVDFTDLSSVTNGSIVSWLWNFGDSTISLQQHPGHFFSSIGTYFVCLTSSSGFGCSNTTCDSVYVVGAGIEDYPAENFQVFISPNPAQNEIMVRVPGADKTMPVFEILDLTGNKFSISTEVKAKETFYISLPELADGIYLLKVLTGQKLAVKKILVAH